MNFADSHEVVYRTFKIQEMPPPEGMKVNEMRCAILQLFTDSLCMAELRLPHPNAAMHAIADVLPSDLISTQASKMSKADATDAGQ